MISVVSILGVTGDEDNNIVAIVLTVKDLKHLP